MVTLQPDPMPPARVARVVVSYRVTFRDSIGGGVWTCLYPARGRVWRVCWPAKEV